MSDLPELLTRDQYSDDEDTVASTKTLDTIDRWEEDYEDFIFFPADEGDWQPKYDAEQLEAMMTKVESNHTVPTKPATTDDTKPTVVDKIVKLFRWAFPQKIRRKFTDLDILKPNFGWVSEERIKSTLEQTTQFYRATPHTPFRKHFKSRFPAANVRRLNETFATDTYFSDVPAADDGVPGHGGCTMAQVYVGCTSEFMEIFPMSTESEVPETLENFIRKWGAMKCLFSDNAKSETSNAVKQLQRMYCIDDAQSEPHYQHQNYAERKIQDVKRMSNNIMDRVGCPAKYWLLALTFVIGLVNVLVNSNGEIPNTLVTGEVTDISPWLQFHFWEEVFIATDKGGEEVLARWVYPASNVGDKLTYWVLLNETNRLVARSNVRSAKDPMFPNRRARPSRPITQLSDSSEGEIEVTDRPVIATVQDSYGSEFVKIPKFSPEELLGITFLRETPDDEVIRAKVIRKVLDRDAENHENIKFLISLGDDELEELISYNELCDIIEDQWSAEERGEQPVFAFKSITGHQGPLFKNDPRYKGSSYNVKVLWEDGTETWEPLNMMVKDDKATMAKYAKENGLLDTPGWKNLRKLASRLKLLNRMIRMANARSEANAVRYKFGVRVPRNVKEALELDRQNGNTYWADAMHAEIEQLHEYSTFRSVGFNGRTPDGYQRIPARMVFDVKSTLKRKARFVAGGHKTRDPDDSVYSSVASLRSLRMVTVLAELNDLKLTGGDVGNAYLEAFTSEKVCFTAGPEFGPLAGHTLVIVKALYGLKSSGARFHDKFATTMRALGFTPSYADPDVWLRDAGDCYEYVVVYVDDLYTALKEPKVFFDALMSDPWNYKLKGVEEPRYHLGGDFFRDKDGTFCYGAQTYVKRLVKNYEVLFGESPKDYFSPMEKDDHPELDETPLCGPDDTAKFQSMIGALQWTIQLCRFDISQAVMSMSRFRAAPRIGHLERVKRIVGYLKKFPHAAIRFRTGIPNHEAEFGENYQTYGWESTVYGNAKEDIPDNAPEPKGKPVRLTTHVDANLMHDLVTGRSCTGCLHYMNQTPVDWYCKRQDQVETATYGSEFMAARQATEQIMDLRYTLRMFGVPLDGPSWLFGDNKSVVTSSTIPHSVLSKRWNALSYHRVREAVASGVLRFHHISGLENPADILTKALPHFKFRVFTDPLLFWKGETNETLEADARGECHDDLATALDGVATSPRTTAHTHVGFNQD